MSGLVPTMKHVIPIMEKQGGALIVIIV